MIVSNHHILYDGWSTSLILKEVLNAYNNLYRRLDLIKIKKTKFEQFIKYLNSINKEEEKRYWRKYLDLLKEKDDYFSCEKIGDYIETSYVIDKQKTIKINEYTKKNKVLLSAILYSAKVEFDL